MRTNTIEQFRAILDLRTEQGPLVRAYRELARRPERAIGRQFSDWAAWPSVATPVASA